MIIGLIGEKLAGKDEIGAHLVKKYGALYVKYSQILDDILGILDMPVSRRNEIDLGRVLRDVFKMNVLWGGLRKRISESAASVKVISSIRLGDEYEKARELGAKFIYVTAPQRLRYERSLVRNEKADDGRQSFEEFLAQEKEWTEAEIPKLGAGAEFKIENAGTLEDLQRKVDDIMAQLT